MWSCCGGWCARLQPSAPHRPPRCNALLSSIRGQTAVARQSSRQSRSLPLIADMKPWLRSSCPTRPAAVSDAIRYTLTRWDARCCFLDDGRLELDTNAVERAGRKNHLFAGSDGGAERWATAKRNDIEPFAYLEDVLERMSKGHLMIQLDDLLPWNWRSSTALN